MHFHFCFILLTKKYFSFSVLVLVKDDSGGVLQVPQVNTHFHFLEKEKSNVDITHFRN